MVKYPFFERFYSSELRKREHEKETVAPFSPTNHALIFKRALTLRRRPYYLRAWERLHTVKPRFTDNFFFITDERKPLHFL